MKLGLTFVSAPRLGYQMNGGFGCGWLPDWVQRAIETAWNWVLCRFIGHELLDYLPLTGEDRLVCLGCCAEVLRPEGAPE